MRRFCFRNEGGCEVSPEPLTSYMVKRYIVCIYILKNVYIIYIHKWIRVIEPNARKQGWIGGWGGEQSHRVLPLTLRCPSMDLIDIACMQLPNSFSEARDLTQQMSQLI